VPEPAEIIAAVYLNCHVRVLNDPHALGKACVTALRADGWSVIRAEELERLRASQLPEGTETEWAIRIDSGDITAEDEATARKLLGMFRENGTPAGLYRRQVTPWTEVPGQEVPGDC